MNNIEINDKLETDIENKYIKYKENVKFTTEEAIYILKRKDFCDEIENIAIENLIQENKELKEETTENQDYIKDLQKKLTNAIEIKYIHQDYIPKSKLKELEEYANWHIEHLTEDIADYIDDDRKGNASIIGEFKEEREHWKDIIRIINNEKTYIDYKNY